MRRVHADRAARPGVRSIAMAHAFVSPTAGALVESDSERDISVGGVSMVSTDVFYGMAYVALGHLHGRHTLTDSIRYSGRSEEHTSELQSLMRISYAVFCLNKNTHITHAQVQKIT